MITIDGSFGEGGGQILRTSLALSAITGAPVTLENIRGGRRKPGLLRQHLTGLRALQQVCEAEVDGAVLRSDRVVFRPGRIQGGAFRFDVQSAGSANLVLQTVLPALLMADGPSTVTIVGGTHNPASPPADFLQRTFLPQLAKMGARVDLRLERHGFYPAGGGVLTASITPAEWQPLVLENRGTLNRLTGSVRSAHLARQIAKREAHTLRDAEPTAIVEVERVDSAGPGNVVLMTAETTHIDHVCCAFGRKGAPAEAVAMEAVDGMREWLAQDWPVGPYLADQLLIPVALAGGVFATGPLSLHARTNVAVIERFLGPRFAIQTRASGRVVVEGSAASAARAT